MNQPQRMAPVGTDKELNDLLDFSMVSQALPTSAALPVAPGSWGEAAAKIPPTVRPHTCLDGRAPRWGWGIEVPFDEQADHPIALYSIGALVGFQRHLSPRCLLRCRMGPVHTL